MNAVTLQENFSDTGDCAGQRTQRGQWLFHLRSSLSLYRARIDQRRQLRLLSDDLLKDIGITREEADREASKACWLP